MWDSACSHFCVMLRMLRKGGVAFDKTDNLSFSDIFQQNLVQVYILLYLHGLLK